MPKFDVTVCFTSWRYYTVQVEAENEDAIDREAAIDLASQVEEPDNVESGGAEVIETTEINPSHPG